MRTEVLHDHLHLAPVLDGQAKEGRLLVLHLHMAPPNMDIRYKRKLFCDSSSTYIWLVYLSACKRSVVSSLSTALNSWQELLAQLLKTGGDKAASLASLEPAQLVDIPLIQTIHMQASEEGVSMAGVVWHHVPAWGNQGGGAGRTYLQ